MYTEYSTKTINEWVRILFSNLTLENPHLTIRELSFQFSSIYAHFTLEDFHLIYTDGGRNQMETSESLRSLSVQCSHIAKENLRRMTAVHFVEYPCRLFTSMQALLVALQIYQTFALLNIRHFFLKVYLSILML